MYPTINKTSANDCVLTEIWIKYIEGEKIPDTSIRMTTPPTLSIIPRGHIWVEGDNSSVSHDSRNFGPVPLALVHSKLFLRVWPPSQFGWIK
ncbi:mitochondrial inner membrane protease subunit 1-like [Gigantopelta aegis]|uniref:mitochondrial inner membrane protease subunit 1-like n=1 Tax=Gigantopelta aegis TaxID=1735272 RepID=UPI001B88D0C1|nr:mitochondrial inner membrane protease subunit 1-like [Gigantopelta aegis]